MKSTVRFLAAAALIPSALGIGLFALGFFTHILAVMCMAGLLAVLVAPPGQVRHGFLAICVLAACFVTAELTLRMVGEPAMLPSSADDNRRVMSSGPLFREDMDYGYSLTPSSAFRVTASRDGERIYDAIYTIDAQGGRVAPPPNNGEVAIVLAGDSYNFGEGVRDDQTLAYFLQQRSHQVLRVPTMAVPGYGLHQLLRQLELGLPGRHGAAMFEWLVLSVGESPIARANGHFEQSRGSPRYELNERGQPIYAGTFDGEASFEWHRRLLHVSLLYKSVWQAWTSLAPSHDSEVFVALLRRIQDLAARKYGARVLVLYHAGFLHANDYAGQRAQYHRLFSEAGVPFIDVNLAQPDVDASYFIAGDGHPAAKLNALLAELVLKTTKVELE